IRDKLVTGVQTCALPISSRSRRFGWRLYLFQGRLGHCAARSFEAHLRISLVLLSRLPAAEKATPRPSVLPAIVLPSSGRHSPRPGRSEEHTSELQSLAYLVCR